MRIKKAGILIIAAAITCTTPAVPAMAADTSESVQEIISDNEIDSLVSDLRSAVTKAYDKLEEMGIGKEEVKGILHKLADFAKSLFE